jgi:hypothetical protein
MATKRFQRGWNYEAMDASRPGGPWKKAPNKPTRPKYAIKGRWPADWLPDVRGGSVKGKILRHRRGYGTRGSR